MYFTYTPSFFKHFNSVKHICKSTKANTHILRTLTFLKGMNNGTQERGVRGAVWHIAGTNLPAARGKCWVDTAQRLTVGQGLGPLATDRHQQGAEAAERSTTHKHWNTHSHLLLFGLTLLSSPSLSRRGGCLSRIRHPRVPAAAPVNACISFLCFRSSFLGVCCLASLCPRCAPLNDKGIPQCQMDLPPRQPTLPS